MQIGILGSGDVAKSLGNGFLKAGHSVMLGSRDPQKLDSWKDESGDQARVGTFSDTAEFGEVIVLATLGIATEEAIAQAGDGNFSGKLVLDATNPLEVTGGAPALAWGFNSSNGERIQRAIPKAKVVKAFNTVGNTLFYRPDLRGGPPTMFIAGNDVDAKKRTVQILDEFGWESADIGGIESSRYLEAMCIAWVMYGVTNNAWSGHAFKLLRK